MNTTKRATILLMVVGLLAMLFVIVSAYITLARFEANKRPLVDRRAELDRIVDTVNNLVLQQMRNQWTDADGNLLAGGKDAAGAVLDTYAFEDIAGHRGSRFQGALEPVRDLTKPNPDANPGSYFYPAVTSLRGTDGVHADANYPPDTYQSTSIDELLGIRPSWRWSKAQTQYYGELVKRARAPFQDADGDGIPDSSLMLAGLATELANAIAGIAVRTPQRMIEQNWNLHDVGSGTAAQLNAWKAEWRRFDELARYEVAVRVVPHGGMVALESPGQGYGWGSPNNPWNREFLTDLFNRSKHPDETIKVVTPADALFQDVAAAGPAIEPVLRRRGGSLASYLAENGTAQRRVVQALRGLEARFPLTFVPTYATGGRKLKNDTWQRYNLAADWVAWRRGSALDATDINRQRQAGTVDPNLRHYSRRQTFTSISHSDDVARDQGSASAGIVPGQLKFYLGEVMGAFNADRTYNVAAGHAVIQRLVPYFHEMLGGHDDWGTGSGKEGVGRLEQAYMLAVNTVAFAAPRINGGSYDNWVDVVTADERDPNGVPTNREFVGYGPQPFITQVLVHKDRNDSVDPPLFPRALCVELYNPNERYGAPADEHELDLAQFGISLNTAYETGGPPSMLVLTDAPPPGGYRGIATIAKRRLPGRSFASVVIHDLSNDVFLPGDSPPPADALIGVSAELDVEAGQNQWSNAITVKLWRRAIAPDTLGNVRWYLVDEFELDDPNDPPKPPDGEEVVPEWVDAYRDTTYEFYWGADLAGAPARWRMVTSFLPASLSDVPGYETGIDNEFHASERESGMANFKNRVATLGRDAPAVGSGKDAPTAPLYTPNANLGFTRIHGVNRPNSFPTVGFMLFVPRFAHTGNPLTHEYTPVTKYMRKHVIGRQYDNREKVPADFGHMPVFDNKQETDGYFDKDDAKAAGPVPWGQLVFDYFTTVNPNGNDPAPTNTADDIDPYRIPGRININAAPWHVLANIPVLGPTPTTGSIEVLDGINASPAFWSASSGILLGRDSANIPRFIAGAQNLIAYNASYNPAGRWHHLGPELAQSICSYRDRVQYASDGRAAVIGTEPRTSYWYADERNLGVADPQRGYRPTLYGSLRGHDPAKMKYGLVSLGELANVKGFDSTVYVRDAGVPLPSTAGVQVVPPLSDPTGMTGYEGDFFKAVSLLALLDTHFLTTRSNTFTVYVTLTDRENPQVSVRSQLTVDRSNLLPRPVLDGTALISLQNNGLPEIVAQRRIGYYNARFDD